MIRFVEKINFYGAYQGDSHFHKVIKSRPIITANQKCHDCQTIALNNRGTFSFYRFGTLSHLNDFRVRHFAWSVLQNISHFRITGPPQICGVILFVEHTMLNCKIADINMFLRRILYYRKNKLADRIIIEGFIQQRMNAPLTI